MSRQKSMHRTRRKSRLHPSYLEFLEERRLLSAINTAGVTWSTYFGGSQNEGVDGPAGIAIDASGNKLIGGWTGSSNLPDATNSYSGADEDGYVAKFDPGGNLIWTTYIGTSDTTEVEGIAVDSAGDSLVTGRCDADGLDNELNSPFGGEDAFVAKLDPNGNILWSLYLGGSSDDNGASITVDASGSAYITGHTLSDDFNDASGTYAGNEDVFLAKVDSDGTLAWATYFGGSGMDKTGGIAVDSAGETLIAGITSSQTLPNATNTYHGGASDAFVAKFDPSGSEQWVTYIGGSGTEAFQGGNSSIAGAVAWDTDGTALVTGYTESSNLTLAKNKYGGGGDGFVSKIDSNGNVLWSDYLGGGKTDFGVDVAIDGQHNAIVVGGENFTSLMATTMDDMVAKISPSGTLDWIHQFGGSKNDYAGSVAIDGDGNAWIAGNTWSSDFPEADNSSPGGDPSQGPDEPLNAFVAEITAYSLTQSVQTGFAPNSIAGDTVIISGPTSFARVTFSSGNSGTIEDFLHSGNSAIQYSYVVTGQSLATLGLVIGTDDVTVMLNFATTTSGSGFIYDPAHINDTCSFTIFTSSPHNLAPSSVAGGTVFQSITDGNGPFDSSGVASLTLNSGQTFNWTVNSSSASTGAYTYTSSIGSHPGIAKVVLSPTGGGNPDYLYLVFISATSGMFYVTDSLHADDPADYDEGSFSLGFPANHLIISAPPATVVAGQPIGSTLTVSVEDVHGNAVNDDSSTVALSLLNTNATLGGITSVQAIDGVATFTGLTLDQAGNYTLVAGDTDDSLPSVDSKKFTVLPNATNSHLALAQQPNAATVGLPLTPTLTVNVEDQFGNIITTNSSKVTLGVVSGPGTLGGTTTVAASKGIALFPKATLLTAGNYNLSASDSSLAVTTPVNFTQSIEQAVTTIAAPHPSASYNFGQTISLSTTLKSNAPSSIPFAGNAEIFDGEGDPLGTVVAVAANGAVKFTLPTISGDTALIASGTYSNCTLVYLGDSNHAADTTSGFTLVVKPVATKTTLVPSVTQLTSGQSLTLSATVSSTAVSSVLRTGNAIFLDNGVAFGTVTLTGSSAATTFAPNPGVHNYSIQYAGDANFLLSSAAAKPVTDNLAPGAIAGDTFLLSNLAGTGDKDPPGLDLETIATSGNGITQDDLSFSGTKNYTYTYKQTGPTTATLTATTTASPKVTVTLQLTFSSNSSGMTQAKFSTGETGTASFILYTSPIASNAPANLNDAVVTLTATGGNSPLGSSGTMQWSLNDSSSAYTLISTSGGSVNTSGSDTTSPVNASIIDIQYDDENIHSGALYLAFTSPTGGVYYFVNSTSEWQAGSFTI